MTETTETGVHPLRSRIARSLQEAWGNQDANDRNLTFGMLADAIIADLGIEQVGWLEDADTDDPAPIKMKHGKAFYAGDVGVCVPLYRLSDAGGDSK